jgi:predicted  nucleic acid-binding Zn-ribbon protein
MKATYQLNNDKLEHNFRLLAEREFEHTQHIQQQKKKINRLQDLLSSLRAKYVRTDKKFRQRNLELTDEYRRITEQYKVGQHSNNSNNKHSKHQHLLQTFAGLANQVPTLSRARLQEVLPNMGHE